MIPISDIQLIERTKNRTMEIRCHKLYDDSRKMETAELTTKAVFK